MVMKILSRPRRYGKTYQAVLESAKSRARIVTLDNNEAARIKRMALDLGLNIPEPLSMSDAYHKNAGRRERVIVDNVDWVMRTLLNAHVHGITVDGPPAEIMWSEAKQPPTQ